MYTLYNTTLLAIKITMYVIKANITVVFHFEFLNLPVHQLYLTSSPISLLSSAGKVSE